MINVFISIIHSLIIDNKHVSKVNIYMYNKQDMTKDFGREKGEIGS